MSWNTPPRNFAIDKKVATAATVTPLKCVGWVAVVLTLAAFASLFALTEVHAGIKLAVAGVALTVSAIAGIAQSKAEKEIARLADRPLARIGVDGVELNRVQRLWADINYVHIGGLAVTLALTDGTTDIRQFKGLLSPATFDELVAELNEHAAALDVPVKGAPGR